MNASRGILFFFASSNSSMAFLDILHCAQALQPNCWWNTLNMRYDTNKYPYLIVFVYVMISTPVSSLHILKRVNASLARPVFAATDIKEL